MVEALDGTPIGIAATTLQVQAGTERTGTLRTASSEGAESGGDTVSISDEGRQKAAGMASSGAGGAAPTEDSDKADQLKALREQIKNLREKIKEKQQELQEIQEDENLDADQRQKQASMKMTEITMLQSQLTELQKQLSKLETGGGDSAGSDGAVGVNIRA